MDARLAQVSRYLSFLLRHRPDAVGLELDAQGWAEIEELIGAAARDGHDLSRSLIEEVVARNDKQRFALSADGARIRAVQGHSLPVDLGLPPSDPPEILYHGTAVSRLDAILAEGLTPRGRRQVHLSRDVETATAVGRRHGPPVVLRIEAGDMHRAGHEFHLSENGVWLTDRVPPEYIEVTG